MTAGSLRAIIIRSFDRVAHLSWNGLRRRSLASVNRSNVNSSNESASFGKSARRNRIALHSDPLARREEKLEELLTAVERLLKHLAHHVPAEGVHLEHISKLIKELRQP